MALFFADNVKVATTTTGTGSFGIGAAASGGFLDFEDAEVPDGAEVFYTAYTATQRETGLGTYSESGQTVSRDTIYSPPAGTAVNFSTSPTLAIAPIAAVMDGLIRNPLQANLDMGGFALTDTTGNDANKKFEFLPTAGTRAYLGAHADSFNFMVESQYTGTYGCKLNLWHNTNSANNNVPGYIGVDTRDSSGGGTYVGEIIGRVKTASAAGFDTSWQFYTVTGGSNNIGIRCSIDSDGLKFGSSVAAARGLNDYETGTWTPSYSPETNSFTSITYDSLRGGLYCKIGNLVHIQGVIRTDAITVGTATDSIRISGLPFAAAAGDATTNGTSGIVVSWAGSWTGEHPLSGRVLANGSLIWLNYRTSITGGQATSLVSDLGTGADANLLYFSGTYRTG